MRLGTCAEKTAYERNTNPLPVGRLSDNGGADPRGVLHIMAYTGRLRPKGVLFSGFRYIKGNCGVALVGTRGGT